MKKIGLLMLIGLSYHLSVLAQPSIIINDRTPDIGEEFCVPVTVRNFTLITRLNFSISFDSDAISLLPANAVNNINPALIGLTPGGPGEDQIDISQAGNGTITIQWDEGATGVSCIDPSVLGTTLEDNEVLFDLCFTNNMPYGESTEIEIGGDPVNINVERKFSTGACQNITLNGEVGTISSGVRPFTISSSSAEGKPGELVCVDIDIEQGWDSLQSFQFTLAYDRNFLELDDVLVNDDIPFNSPGIVAEGPTGISVGWNSDGISFISVDDNTNFFTACFNIIGECEQSTTFEFTNDPVPIEVVNSATVDPENVVPIPFVGEPGIVRSTTCSPSGLQVNVDCGPPVNLNDEVCVNIRAGDNFQNVTDMSYLLSWNESILEFNRVVTSGSSIGLNAGDFDTSNSENGVLRIDYNHNPLPPATLSNNAVVYQVCFNVIGLGGDSPIQISGPATVRTTTSPLNIGINPSNCPVRVNQPSEVVVNIGDTEASSSTPGCFPVTVANFQDVTTFEFGISLEVGLFDFVSFQNEAIPGATLDAVGPVISYRYSGDPVSLNNNDVLFEVCVEANTAALPNECGPVTFDDFPVIPTAITTSSNGENIGITSSDGEVCVLFPEGFALTAEFTSGFRDTTVCMPFTVREFQDILTAQFTIDWDPSALEYVSAVVNPAIQGLSFDEASTAAGLLGVDLSNGTPQSLADDEVLLTLCFNTVGAARNCYPVGLDPNGPPTTTTVNGEGSIVFTDGELCIDDRFIINSVIVTNPSCPGATDGSVQLVVSGGQGIIGTTWQTSPAQFTPLQAQNLGEGMVVYTLFDQGDPAIFFTDSVMLVASTENLPVADAGMDRTLTCTGANQQVLLSSNNTNSIGSNFTWLQVTGENSPPRALNADPILQSEPGFYILEAMNEAGCTDQDTMQIFAPSLPTAVAGPDQTLLCNPDSLLLTSTGSSTDSVTYRWSRLNPSGPEEFIDEAAQLRVGTFGRFQLEVQSLETGCSDFDTLFVADGRIFPAAVAGDDLEQVCDGSSLTLDGSNSTNTGLDVTYAWYDGSGNLLANGLTAQASELGSYIFEVTETTTGCSTTDTLTILPNPEAPEVIASADVIFDCFTDTLSLLADIKADTSSFSVLWTSPDGGQIVPGDETEINARVTAPGTYLVTVTDLNNNCEAIDTTIVFNQLIFPTAEAGPEVTLDCGASNVLLDGSGSFSEDELTFEWFFRGEPIPNSDQASLAVSQVGTYLLEVTSNETGCTSIDSVEVVPDPNAPAIQLNELATGLTCSNRELNITAGVTPAGGNYTILWTPVDGIGNIEGPNDQLTVTVTEAGNYELTVINNDNGCSTTAQTTVDDSEIIPPNIVLAADTVDINCIQATATLDGTGSSSEPEFVYEWSAIQDGEPITLPNNPSVEVATPGIYRLIIRNTQTSCENSATVLVRDQQAPPQIDTLAVDALNCVNAETAIAITVGNASSDPQISWQGLSGQPLSSTTGLSTMVTQVGDYEVLVRNPITGCDARDTITVSGSFDAPEILFNLPDTFSCLVNSISLDAGESGAPSEFSEITWTAPEGNTAFPSTGALAVAVDGPGTYTLTLTGTNGCSSTSEVVVPSNQDFPIADAGMDDALECGETLQLDGSGSSQGQGGVFNYTWSTVTGIPLGGDLNGLTPTTSGGGTYVLVVSNTTNGCISSDTVQVDQITPSAADAGVSINTCADNVTLTANLPAGTEGVWTTSSTAIIGNPAAAETNVEALASGTNEFTWTLSAPGCPDYSTASVLVNREAVPLATDDVLEIGRNTREGTVNVAANDQLNGVTNFTVTLLDQPLFGLVDSISADGEIFYSVGIGANGETEISYEICSNNCPDLCSRALVTIRVADDGREPEFPNAITANGDGINDALFFDLLANNSPEAFPDNELIIFNRWGDIVFQAKPYNNDWTGLSDSGDLLPEGTYYYILRLNIGEGEIIRGDITILR